MLELYLFIFLRAWILERELSEKIKKQLYFFLRIAKNFELKIYLSVCKYFHARF